MARRFNRRRVLKLLGFPALLGAGGTSYALWRGENNPYYSGPVSDHFDGVRFYSPSGEAPNTFGRFLRWQFSGGREAWPETYPSPPPAKPAPRVNGGDLAVTYVGHASHLVQAGGLNILLDPHWSERASPVRFAGPKRVNPPGIAFEDLPPIDAVLLTHNHYDHLDLPTLARLAAGHRPRVIAPLGNDAIMRAHDAAIRAEAHDWGAAIALSDGVRIHLEPCYHWSARGLFDRRMALWSAFVIETPAGKIYHIGDTGYGDGAVFRAARAKHGDLRLAILPIGSYEPRWFMKSQHVNPEESVKIFADCGARDAMAHHWGTFQLTNEGIERPLTALSTAIAEAGVAADRFRVLRPGQTWSVSASV